MHQILRQTVEFEVDRAHSSQVQEAVRVLCRHSLPEIIERECNRLLEGREEGETLRIPRIEIDLGELKWGDQMGDQFISAFEREFRIKLTETSVSENINAENDATEPTTVAETPKSDAWPTTTPAELAVHRTSLEIVAHYLSVGLLPWQTIAPGKDSVQKAFQELVNEGLEASERTYLKTLLASDSSAIGRLVIELSDNQLAELAVELDFVPFGLVISDVLKFVEDKKDTDENRSVRTTPHQLWTQVFKGACRHADFSLPDQQNPKGETVFARTHPDHAPEDTAHLDHPKGHLPEIEHDTIALIESSPFSANEEILIQNAGLILLWPFLPQLFQNLELLDSEKQFRSDESKIQAILALEYLATGEDETSAAMLALNRILCGLPPDAIHPIRFQQEAEIQTICDNFLTSIASREEVWGHISPNGFRSAWLQRKGVILPTPGGWKLHVESAPYDVILDRLPWEISTVKLSWMNAVILVAW